MTRFQKYCRTLLAGALIFGGAVVISVVGGSLSASPAAASVESIIPTLGAPGDDGSVGSLDLPGGAKPDPSAWTVEQSANLLGKQGLLESDSCGSANSCMAVGFGIDVAGIEQTEAEAWNGSKWSVQKLPTTPGDRASQFLGVSCPSAKTCTAVGSYLESSGVQASLAEVWNGSKWSIETTRNPSGAQVSSLESVSCTSSSKCVAVGGSEGSSSDSTTFIEIRNGTSWSIESSPNPSGSEGDVLRSVACTSTSSCNSVGAYYNSSGTLLTLAEAWNGKAWSIKTTPNPSGSTENILSGVSCVSTGACAAVGDYVSGAGPEEALAEEWNGSSWSVEVVPNPSGAQQSVLAAVACRTAGGCTAVGGFIDNSGPEMTLAEAWNGTSWSVETTPNPSGAQLSGLAGVSCNSAGGCTAAGYFQSASSSGTTLAESWNGTTWSIQASADSKGVVKDADLVDVACTSANACIAVGVGVSGVATALVEVWNGTSWSIRATPNPSGAEQSVLDSVACTSPTSCTAVGGYADNPGAFVTLAESWNGTSWSIEATPEPTGAEGSSLAGVSCTSAHACSAVGYYTDSSGVEDTLAEAWNGTSWSIQTTPVPSGAEESSLVGVSCTSAGTCTAVGSSTDSSGVEDTLAEVWDGTSWSIQTTPVPSGAELSGFSGVSCTSSGACTAVGAYSDGTVGMDALAETWNGTSWSIDSTPVPSGAEGSSLADVSCTSAGSCSAVGSYTNSSGVEDTLAEVWNGTSWSIQTTPNPSGAQLPTLSGVSCITSKGCTAVGDYNTISAVILTLVEVGPLP